MTTAAQAGRALRPDGLLHDDVLQVATAIIDRLIHAETLSLKADSYRLRGRSLDARPARHPENPARKWSSPTSRQIKQSAVGAQARLNSVCACSSGVTIAPSSIWRVPPQHAAVALPRA